MATPTPAVESLPGSCRCQASIEAVKALHIMVASLMADLSALRRAVLEDPEFAQLYAIHLAEATRTARPLLSEALACYDALLSPKELAH